MKKEDAFSVIIRIVFIMAFGSFLWASIHHIATFFHNFEPDGTDWSGSYALAISVDGTALVLTIGTMFFSKTMSTLSKVITWAFIIGLTAFSWMVNWEYAVTYQATTITGHLDPIWLYINPVLASSFAFLNLAYSVVAEFFNAKVKSEADLLAELDGLTGSRASLERQIAEAKRNKPGLIQQAKDKAIEMKSAYDEVRGKDQPPVISTTNVVDKEIVTPPIDSVVDVIEEVFTPIVVEQEETEDDRKLTLTLQFLDAYPQKVDAWTAEDDIQLAQYLDLQRVASARFWRLRALEIWTPKTTITPEVSTPSDVLAVQTPRKQQQKKNMSHAATTIKQRNEQRVKSYAVAHPDETAQEIATALELSVRTVQRHLSPSDKRQQDGPPRLKIVQ